ncbi:hypothetical protein, partial [Methanosarcina sp. 2.H.T.1A.15]|uniref:hypothetical protein n=2 Tax=Methanosarcina TaxID=2207 RepID=UPI00064EA748
TEGQSTSDAGQQDNSGAVVGSESSSKENRNSGLRIASFVIGFLVIIVMGIIIKKKVDQNN